MDHDHPPEPPANQAAQAFAQLGERVAAMEGQMAAMLRAFEQAAAQQGPDHNATLVKLAGNMAEVGKRMKAVEQSALLRMSPEALAEHIVTAADMARKDDQRAIRELKELARDTMTAMRNVTGRLRDRTEQCWHMVYAAGGAALAASLLWLAWPGWAANVAPGSWHWPESVARRALVEPTLWDAGIHLMRTGNPQAWQAIVDAARMQDDNHAVLTACERTATKAKKPIPCTITVKPAS
ncbi:MAG: DUF6118 family protein [Sphingobium sp.]